MSTPASRRPALLEAAPPRHGRPCAGHPRLFRPIARFLRNLPLVLALAVPGFAQAAQYASYEPAASHPGLSQLAIAPGQHPTATSHADAAGVRPAPVTGPAPDRVALNRPASADPATLCETAVTTAEFVNRLPPRMLGAVALTESGRVDAASGRVRPWPWTINAEGAGQFFDTRQAAIAAVKALQARGVQSIDVGCLQVNLMYHPDAFASLDEAFDPRGNANYAARFLNALYAGSKDWPSAIAAYHSETPALGDAYRVLVMARWQNGDPHAGVSGAVAYGDFAQSGAAYGDKAYDNRAYGAFAPASQVYGAFAPR